MRSVTVYILVRKPMRLISDILWNLTNESIIHWMGDSVVGTSFSSPWTVKPHPSETGSIFIGLKWLPFAFCTCQNVCPFITIIAGTYCYYCAKELHRLWWNTSRLFNLLRTRCRRSCAITHDCLEVLTWQNIKVGFIFSCIWNTNFVRFTRCCHTRVTVIYTI